MENYERNISLEACVGIRMSPMYVCEKIKKTIYGKENYKTNPLKSMKTNYVKIVITQSLILMMSTRGGMHS